MKIGVCDFNFIKVPSKTRVQGFIIRANPCGTLAFDVLLPRGHRFFARQFFSELPNYDRLRRSAL